VNLPDDCEFTIAIQKTFLKDPGKEYSSWERKKRQLYSIIILECAAFSFNFSCKDDPLGLAEVCGVGGIV
jgi:hypothetical protein